MEQVKNCKNCVLLLECLNNKKPLGEYDKAKMICDKYEPEN